MAVLAMVHESEEIYKKALVFRQSVGGSIVSIKQAGIEIDAGGNLKVTGMLPDEEGLHIFAAGKWDSVQCIGPIKND